MTWPDDYVNKILQGDVMERLRDIPDGIVQTVVTSPPYWGLRDYSVDGQLGLEKTPELYIEKMVAIFREVRRVLRDDGTLWLNMGDSYAGNHTTYDGKDTKWQHDKGQNRKEVGRSLIAPGLKLKDLCGIPWRVALALQADGWWLRSDIIWSKPNPMPESCTDRPTKAHEYIFLLTKKAKYYYDADAIREKSTGQNGMASNFQRESKETDVPGQSKRQHRKDREATFDTAGRNARSVWTIATQPYAEAHFATFPEELARRCILAGSAEQACGVCGAPWERVTKLGKVESTGGSVNNRRNGHTNFGGSDMNCGTFTQREHKTLGFRPTCEHNNGEGRCIVLDPFMGSGTVALVALKGKRDFLGVELNPDYIKMAMKRIEPHLKQEILL